MLLGDYFTYAVKSEYSGCSPRCRACCSNPPEANNITFPSETICHILSVCTAYSDIRNSILSQMNMLCEQSMSGGKI